MIFFKSKNKKKAKAASGSFSLSRKNAWLLWLCQCLNIAVIALELSTWMLGIISLSLVWQALLLHQRGSDNLKLQQDLQNKQKLNQQQKQNKQPGTSKATNVPPLILGVFALLGCLAIVLTAKQVGILVSMLHLLCFSYVLKAFELRARRDFYQLLLLGLFVLAAALIFRQDLAFSLIIFTLLIINLAVLLAVFSSQQKFTNNLKVITVLLGQSALLAVVLFLVFPRLSPFWHVPSAKSAETGLSDTVKPGDIANLARSTKLAFRADFTEQAPPLYSQLYWRAMVLEEYDGRQWTRKTSSSESNKGSKNSQYAKDEIINIKNIGLGTNNSEVQAFNYQVIVEPSYQKYLFALAPAVVSPSVSSSGINAKADYTFTSTKIISQAKSYQLTSYLNEPLALELSSQSKQVNLSYPKGSNPKLEQLAQQLQHNYADVQARAQAVLTMINKQNYSYTLQPPLLDNNSLDQFFFDTQAGFCVHYASAFTFLMRASGIPARMVTGYLGGEFNEANNSSSEKSGHLSIYQYDAHAWSEIWVAGKGWLRIDPTGAVDPLRVNSGWSSELLQQQSALNNELLSLYQMKNIAWLNTLRLQFDALDYQWTRWVIGFSSQRQYDLLKNWFGKMLPWKLALIIAASLIVSMMLLLLALKWLNRTKNKQQPQSPWQLLYQKALKQLSKQGIDKPAAMTVNEFAKQVRELSPEIAIAFTQLSGSYNQLCYQEIPIDKQAKLILAMQHQYRSFNRIIKRS